MDIELARVRPLSCKRHRFPPGIIRRAIRLYARFTLSFRDVEAMLAEPGLDSPTRPCAAGS